MVKVLHARDRKALGVSCVTILSLKLFLYYKKCFTLIRALQLLAKSTFSKEKASHAMNPEVRNAHSNTSNSLYELTSDISFSFDL